MKTVTTIEATAKWQFPLMNLLSNVPRDEGRRRPSVCETPLPGCLHVPSGGVESAVKAATSYIDSRNG
jgi:hypothetical protein